MAKATDDIAECFIVSDLSFHGFCLLLSGQFLIYNRTLISVLAAVGLFALKNELRAFSYFATELWPLRKTTSVQLRIL